MYRPAFLLVEVGVVGVHVVAVANQEAVTVLHHHVAGRGVRGVLVSHVASRMGVGRLMVLGGLVIIVSNIAIVLVKDRHVVEPDVVGVVPIRSHVERKTGLGHHGVVVQLHVVKTRQGLVIRRNAVELNVLGRAPEAVA